MGVLSGAMPRQGGGSSNAPTVKSDEGSYRAYFIGMTEPVAERSAYGDKCRVCKGTGAGKNGEAQGCTFCAGDGERVEKYVRLLYSLETGVVEEEKVTFKLSPPGTGRDGTPLSASTLFKRMRTFSGLREADAAALDQWFSSFGDKPIKIPITVNIGYNNDGSLLKITDVVGRKGPQPTNAPVQRQTAPAAAQGAPEAYYNDVRYDAAGNTIGGSTDGFDDLEVPF